MQNGVVQAEALLEAGNFSNYPAAYPLAQFLAASLYFNYFVGVWKERFGIRGQRTVAHSFSLRTYKNLLMVMYGLLPICRKKLCPRIPTVRELRR